jgi:aspartate-semialdehyde dehydrogenase
LAKQTKLALVGSESLLGREIRDIAATSAPEIELQLIAGSGGEEGSLTRVGDEPAFVSGLTPESFAGTAGMFLAGSQESGAKALELASGESGFTIIDLTGVAEESPDARLRAPSIETEVDDREAAVQVIAHPAAIAVALFLRRLQEHDAVRRSVIQIFAPASELGSRALEELQQQTVGLLSFQQTPRAVFDAQLAFNLLARYGDEAPVSLEHAELRIERHLATLLALPGEGEGAPMPSLRLVQAPVFHGYSFSAWVEFENNPGLEAIESGLASDWIDVRGAESEPPSNVGQAGEGGVAVGAIAEDRNDPNACWFWVVADNLRLLAENAVAVARELA